MLADTLFSPRHYRHAASLRRFHATIIDFTPAIAIRLPAATTLPSPFFIHLRH